MSETPESMPFAETFAKPEALMRVPVGFASPLWGLFAGAAIGGSAWWWMTRWARPENLEAMFGAAAELPGMAALTSVAAEPAIEAAEAAVEIVVEAELSAVDVVEAEVAAAETVMSAPELDFPVGGEAGPIAAALAGLEPEAPEPETVTPVAPAPKPRVRKADPKPE